MADLSIEAGIDRLIVWDPHSEGQRETGDNESKIKREY